MKTKGSGTNQHTFLTMSGFINGISIDGINGGRMVQCPVAVVRIDGNVRLRERIFLGYLQCFVTGRGASTRNVQPPLLLQIAIAATAAACCYCHN